MRQLATIRTISDLRPIPNADRIVVAQVDGWECVVPKDEFHVGDHIVYIEVDSVLPERPEFEFMRDRKFRVRTIKLRGQVSQGLVFPPYNSPAWELHCRYGCHRVTRYHKVRPTGATGSTAFAAAEKSKNPLTAFLMRFKWYRKLFAKAKRKGGFPNWIVKTDETRIQNMPVLFDIESRRGTDFSVTEKVDGQSVTYYLCRLPKQHYEFGVCSRNIRLGTPDNSSYWTVARKYDIENVLRQLIGDKDKIVLQGEICGNGIQGNKYHISGYELFVFNLIFPDHKCSTSEIAQLIEPFGLKTVPIIEENKKLPATIAELVEYSKGLSTVRKGQKREGVVLRNMKSNISFKVLNPDFLLSEGV